ncbi:hypothetical protein ACKA04_02325 [Helcococcus kunzii]|uniref:hypothetical protein n=1 Tax=Helcococcus kunzii TaxID=40091 RepID=UPI0038B0F993
MEKLSDKLARLIDVKSIITIMLTVTFIILSVNEKMTQEFLTIYTVIISFYFGTQYQKYNKEQE